MLDRLKRGFELIKLGKEVTKDNPVLSDGYKYIVKLLDQDGDSQITWKDFQLMKWRTLAKLLAAGLIIVLMGVSYLWVNKQLGL